MNLHYLKSKSSLIVALCLTLLLLVVTVDWYTSGNIVVSFDAESERKIDYQVFYTKDTRDAFSEKCSVKQQVPAGSSHVSIVLPTKKLCRFRLDFGIAPGEVRISSLALQGKEQIELSDFSKFLIVHIDEHQISGNQFILNSSQRDPQLRYQGPLKLYGKQKIDICFLVIIGVISFLLLYKLLLYLSQCKAVSNSSLTDVVFVLCFFGLLYVPMSRISTANISKSENRMLARLPSSKVNGRINLQFGSQFDAWFSDHFRGREEVLAFYNKAKGTIDPGKGNEKVRVGTDGCSTSLMTESRTIPTLRIFLRTP